MEANECCEKFIEALNSKKLDALGLSKQLAALRAQVEELTAANLDLTERVLYAERERDELKAEVARLKGPYGVWESLGEPIEVTEIGTEPYRPHGTWAGLLVPKTAKEGEGPSGGCPAGGEHDWVRESEYCTQCFATKED